MLLYVSALIDLIGILEDLDSSVISRHFYITVTDLLRFQLLAHLPSAKWLTLHKNKIEASLSC